MKINVKHPLFVLAAGLVLVAGSTFGATNAAKADQAKVESVEFKTATIGVKLEQDYDKAMEYLALIEN